MIKYIKKLIKRFILARLYTSCSEITMEKFMLCLEGNLKALIKKPVFFNIDKTLKEVWDNMYMDYIDLVQDPDKTFRLNLIKQITSIEARKTLLSYCADHLKINNSKDLARLYIKLGYNLDDTNLEKSAQRALIRFKAEELKLLELKNQLKAILDKDKALAKGNKARLDYGSVFIEFSRFQKYRLDPKTTTVAEFVHISNQYKAYNTPKETSDGKNRKFNR